MKSQKITFIIFALQYSTCRRASDILIKGPGTYLLEPVAKENCENSELAHGSSNKVNTEMLSEKVLLRKFFRLVMSPKIRKSLFFLQIMIKIYILCQIYIYAQVLHIVKHAFCII